MSFNNVTLESQYTTIPIINKTTIPIRTLSIQLVAQDYPVGFNTIYYGENPSEDITQLIGPTQNQSQNIVNIPYRITIIATIILNGSIYTLPKNLYVYLNKLDNGVTDTIKVTAQNSTLQLLFQLDFTYQFVQNINTSKWIILNSNFTLSNLTLT